MKLRIKGNFIRVRLTKSEVAQFCNDGYVLEQTSFNIGTFSYGVRLQENIDELTASFEKSAIILDVPQKMIHDWSVNDRVGFENTVRLTNGVELHLLLEKDFTCLENRGEDESDNYPNPKLAH